MFVLRLSKVVLTPNSLPSGFSRILKATREFSSVFQNVNISAGEGLFNRVNFKKVNSITIVKKWNSTMLSEKINLLVKKRPVRKKKFGESSTAKHEGFWNVTAFSTAEEYDLENLADALQKEDLYQPTHITTDQNSESEVVHAVAKYQLNSEPRELFFFREGSVVMWNVSDDEGEHILDLVKQFQAGSYNERIVKEESEVMQYTVVGEGKKSQLQGGNILIGSEMESQLVKYTFSNAMALSVKLGIWEASLEGYIDSMEIVTNDLKRGNKIQMTQADVLRKNGELFALRHVINLSSDLLDTPDFYWDREQLEDLFQKMCNFYSMNRRTRVMNEKLNHCVELVELLSSHLSDRHHVRLEWMIIILIMVEVAFEIVHYVDRYIDKDHSTRPHLVH